jgi:hypothetical protein
LSFGNHEPHFTFRAACRDLWRRKFFNRKIMRTRKNKSQSSIEYRNSIWRTEIKGDLGTPLIKGLVISDFIIKWITRFFLIGLTTYKTIMLIDFFF